MVCDIVLDVSTSRLDVSDAELAVVMLLTIVGEYVVVGVCVVVLDGVVDVVVLHAELDATLLLCGGAL